MSHDTDVERLLELALRGERVVLRRYLDECLDRKNFDPGEFLSDVVSPALSRIEQSRREDRITAAAISIVMVSLRLAAGRVIERMADTSNVDSSRGRRILLFCGHGGAEQLDAEIMTAELELDGHEVRFGGDGVPSDEILADVGQWSPDVLLLYASCPSDTPGIRELIDTIRDIDACPNLQIAVGGGVFTRAPGLAEEIGADLWADDAADLREAIIDDPERRAIPEQRTVGRGRRTPKAA
ncbi:MAG: hypothetical protein P8J59_07030 [Phycisphaerales bacterium]|jgi:methanogenic corrinoid protein MtbC1|nr:hypothetical protein [Phycisphaerales bacterium]